MSRDCLGTRLTKVLTTIVVMAIPTAVLADPASDTTDDIRHTIERSLPFLAKHGESWMAEKNCSSCHRVAMMTWAFQDIPKIPKRTASKRRLPMGARLGR